MRGRIAKMFQGIEADAVAQTGDTTLPTDWRQFNETIGLPIHPVTNMPAPLLQYQNDIGTYQGKDLLVVKSNKIGITEVILREGIWRGTVGDCVGYQMMLGAQDRELASENMHRLQSIFAQCRALNTLVLGGDPFKNKRKLELRNGTLYFVMPRRAAAIRGWPRLKWAFPDEAAHYGLLDDTTFPAAIMSRLSNTDGYLRTVSTPLGQRGWFYQKHMQIQAGQINCKEFILPYQVAVGKLISAEYIEEMRQKMPPPQFAQEYECAFIAGQNAAIEPEVAQGAEGEYDLR